MPGWMSQWDADYEKQWQGLQPTKRIPEAAPGATNKLGSAVVDGVMSGGAGVGRAVELAGAVPFIVGEKVTGLNLVQDYFETVDPLYQSADEHWELDPKTGQLGQVAYGLGRIVLPLMAGGGNPNLMMAGEGSHAAVDAAQKGATTTQAVDAATLTAFTFGLGAKVPATVGESALAKVATGVGINVAIGAGYRAEMKAAFDGNPDLQASIPSVGDTTALSTDAALGAIFGSLAAINARRQKMSLPEQDAEAQSGVNAHADATNPVSNPTPQQRQAHSDALIQAQEQLANGQPVTVNNRSLTSAVRAPAAKADVSRLPTGAQLIAEAAHAAGVEANVALAIAHHETGGKFNSDAKNPGSSAHGIGQVTDETWQQFHGGNRSDPKEQARVSVAVIKDYREKAAQTLGREPTAGETYLAYQWGPGGFAKAMKDPSARVEAVIGEEAARLNKWTGKTVQEAVAQTNKRFDKLTNLYGGEAKGGVAYTASGDPVAYAYQVMDAGDLTASHLPDLSINPEFPPELQPRDRTRAASEDQIAQMDMSLRPELLMDSHTASDGAPIVGLDGVVESGNGRTLAIQRHYERGDPNGYRQNLIDNADHFGLDAAEIAGMRQPILVRTRVSEVDRAAFAREANASTVAHMSASERAASDVSRLPDPSLLAVHDDGTINLNGSMDYVRGFVGALPETERGMMMTSDGRPSQEGKRRIETAIVHQAYGDGHLVERLSEHTDGQGKIILNALMKAAAPLAQLAGLVKQGGRHENTIAADVAQAAQRYSDIRASGQTVHDYLNQHQLIDDGLSDGARSMLEVMADNNRSARAIADAIQERIDHVERLGDPRQGNLFGEAAPEPVRTVQNQIADQLAASMYEATPAQDWHTPETPEQQAAFDLMQQNPDLVLANEAGEPVSVMDVMAQLEAEHAMTQEQTTATQAAVSCALQFGD